MRLNASMREGQRLQEQRYKLVPRTLSFLLRGDEVLLIELASDRGAWSGLCNGIGGHIEAGEHPLAAARREIQEEIGLPPGEILLSGVITIESTPELGIGLYVFVGPAPDGSLRSGREGRLTWVGLDRLERERLVPDLPYLLPKALEAYRGHKVFSAAYRSLPDGAMLIEESA